MRSPFDFTTPDGRRAWIRELLAPIDEVKWDALVRKLFAWQYERVPAFARLCAGNGVSPKNLRSWKDIPAMPQQVFKQEKLFAHGHVKPAAIYETSGTTTGEPGRQHLLSTDLYRAVSVEGARRAGIIAGECELEFLIASPEAAPHSSLSAMFGFWRYSSGGSFWATGKSFDFAGLQGRLRALARTGKPVGICGTALSFLGLLEFWDPSDRLRLPPGSWLVETGGFKGRAVNITKADLYQMLGRQFFLRDDQMHNEYGMSELSSQAYARGKNGLHVTPPWARVLVVDPATGREVALGKRGLVRWIDLANTDSVMALQTLDVAERAREGFRLIGRLPRTEPRGCSLSAEEMLKA